MRPDWPSVERVENENGSSSLVLQGPSFNRDVPGQILFFTENNGVEQTAVRATVTDVTAHFCCFASDVGRSRRLPAAVGPALLIFEGVRTGARPNVCGRGVSRTPKSKWSEH